MKKEVPWPQNFILSGTTKSRTTYDSLTMSQWVSGFSQIIREETDPQTKNFMLDYLSDIMDDSQDFGWPSAKGAHAVLLCQMEQDKIQWHETSKIDRVRRAHAQKISQNPHQNKKEPTNPCHVNITKKVLVASLTTMSTMGKCTCMLAPPVIAQEKLIPTPLVNVVVQKTTKALQCSAKNL